MAKKTKSSYAAWRDKYTNIVLISLIVFAVLVVLIAFVYPRIMGQAPDGDVLVKIPRVTTQLESTGNPSKSVTAIFTLEADMAHLSKIDKEAIQKNIRAILAEGDFEMLTGKDSVEYTKNLIKEKLPELMDISSINEMYLIDLQAGDPDRFYIDDASDPGQMSDFLEGIRFK